MPEDGQRVSTVDYQPQQWHKTSVPSTVLSALVKNGVYPDPRIGMNCYQIPDSSDEFNAKHDLAKFSYLPDKRNPWRDPYWYRTEFNLPQVPTGGRVWLELKGINYRADVWLNGQKVADREQMVGMYLRFRLDATPQAKAGKNCLAVLVYPVDHPGEPRHAVGGLRAGPAIHRQGPDEGRHVHDGTSATTACPRFRIGTWAYGKR